MNFEDNYDLDGVAEFVKEQITSIITSETKRVLLAETFLKVLLGQKYTNKEMVPIRDE